MEDTPSEVATPEMTQDVPMDISDDTGNVASETIDSLEEYRHKAGADQQKSIDRSQQHEEGFNLMPEEDSTSGAPGTAASQDENNSSQSQKGNDTNSDQRAKGGNKKTMREKIVRGNMTYEEETELKKTTSIGAILSGLSTGSLGTEAKKNVVKVEGPTKRSRFEDRWNTKKRFSSNYNNFGRGGYGGNHRDNYGDGYGRGNGYGGGYNGGWGSGNTWDNWNNPNEQGNWNNPNEEMGGEQSHSDEWLKEEIKLLDAEFGPGKVTLMHDEDQGMLYICELCQTQLNGRKSLDVHMNGMKHLKKKNTAEKKLKLNNYETLIGDSKKDESAKDRDENSVGNNNVTPVLYGVPPPISYTQPPPLVQGQWGPMGTAPPPPSITPIKSQKTEAPVDDKPKVKSSLSGGATGTLLQKLAACAVKNFKDSDLATNVIIALVKTMKDYNHARGDTMSIEALTEIDIKLRHLKAQMPPPDTDKKGNTASKDTSKTSTPNTISKENASTKPSDAPTNPAGGYNYYSSNSTQSADGNGTWYSNSKGGFAEGTSAPSPYATVPKKAPEQVSSGYATYNSSGNNTAGQTSQPKIDTSYTTGYSPYNTVPNQTASKTSDGYSSKPSNSYYSQQPYNYPGQATPKAVIDIIHSSTAPPPPPPTEPGNEASFGSQNYAAPGYQGGYTGYYNTGGEGYGYGK